MIRFHPYLRRLRRQQWYSLQTTRDKKRNIIRLFAFLICLISIHVVGMVVAEGMSLADAIWLTMTTITTVGYGDVSPGTVWGQVITIILMYLIGISLLAQIVGEWIEFRIDRKERMLKGMWRWDMNDHLVIINAPDRDGDRYLQTLVQQVRNTPSLADCPVQIFSPDFPNGLPDSLRSMGAVHHHGVPQGTDSLSEVDVETARFILILAVNADDFRADSLTLDVLGQLKALAVPGHIIAECVQDDNRSRFRDMGADSVIRPVRAYPELMVRAMAAPGSEEILENLFSHEGVHPRRYNVAIEANNWREVAGRFLTHGLGTPLGFVSHTDEVITNPRVEEAVSAKAIFLIVNHDAIPALSEVENCVNGL